MQCLHYAWITFPLYIHDVSIACSHSYRILLRCRLVLGKALKLVQRSVRSAWTYNNQAAKFGNTKRKKSGGPVHRIS